jgi:hypothetical protein
MADNPQIDSTVRVLRTIIVALVMGVVAYGLFVVFVSNNHDPGQPPDDCKTTCYMAGGFAALMFVLHLVVPNLIARQSANKSDGSQNALIGAFLVKTLVAVALLEGAAFFNLFAYSAGRQWWNLAIAGGLVFFMVLRFPTRASIENWLAPERF